MTDRAQSETLGFALVFALMIASIAIVYTAGFSGLQDVRDVERVNNAQRAFEVLADNVEDITQRNAPSRSTEIKLSGATLTIAEPVEVEVNVTGSPSFAATYEVRPIVYSADTGTELVFVQGAIVRDQGQSGIVVRESNLLLNTSRTVIPIVQTRLDGPGSVGGSTTALIRADHSETTIEFADTSASHTVWYNVTTPRAGIWRDHLEDKGDVTSCQRSGETVSCELTSDRVYVVAIKIDVALE